MTEKIQKRLLDLKAAQDADQPMRCPRCGADTMKHPMATNALSRVADLYICDSCGNAEGLLAFMRHSHPLHRWSVFEPQKPDSDFKARPAKDVLAEILQTQIDKLENTFRLCRNDKENAPWHPYVEKGGQLYKNSFTDGDHEALRDCIAKCRRKWMVTYDVCELVAK